MSEVPQVDEDAARQSFSSILTQEHLATIFNASHDVIFVLDGESNAILHVNESVARVLRYRSDALVGTLFPDLLCEKAPDYLEHCQFFDGVFGPVSFRRSDGEICHGDMTAAVIPWDGVPALLYTLRDATQRTALEEEKSTLIRELQQALATVKRLSGLLPICANCKRIRDDEGYWETVEDYISSHASVHFSHGICPACKEQLYPGLGQGRVRDTVEPGTDNDDGFRRAMERMNSFTGSVDRVTALRLYGLLQQGMLGDCSVAHVDFTDGGSRARIDSWKSLQGMPLRRARAQYVELVGEIAGPLPDSG